MRQEALNVECPNSIAAGAALPCAGLVNKYIHVHGTFTATVSLEGRARGGATPSPWVVIASVSAPGLTAVPQPFAEVRCNVTAFTSGDPEAVLMGDNSRTE